MKRVCSVCLMFSLLLGLLVFGASAASGNASDLNAAGPQDHIMMHDGTNETVLAFRTVVTGTWYGVAPYVGDYGSAGQEFSISVYGWEESYTKTLEGTALCTGKVNDNDGNGYKDFLFDSPLEAGDYLVVYHNGTPGAWGIATWLCAGATTGVQVWLNGAKEDARGIVTRLYVDAPAGSGFSRAPLTDAPIPTLDDPYAAVSGAVSYGYAGAQWNPKAPIALTGNTVAVRMVTEQTCNAFAVYSCCSGNNGGGYVFSVYRWAGKYEETMATDPVCRWMVSNIDNGKFVNFPFADGLAAGDYLFVMSDAFHLSGAGNTVSLFGSPVNSAKAYVTYVNGEQQTDSTVFAWAYMEGTAGTAIAPAAKLIPAVNVNDAPAGSASITFASWNNQEFVNAAEKTVGIRAVVTSDWYGMSFYSSGSATGTGGYIVSVYEWDTDYATSVAGQAVEQRRVEFSGVGVMQVKFGNSLPAGQYLVTVNGGYDSDWGRGILLAEASGGLETETYVNGVVNARHAMAWWYVTAPTGEGIAALPGGMEYRAFQLSAAYEAGTDQSGAYNIRFIASGSDLNVSRAGFHVVATNFEGKEWDANTRTVYSSVSAVTAGGKELEQVDASRYDATYLCAFAITGVPAGTEVIFEVTPYIITEYGTVVYGTSYRVCIAADGSFTQTEIGG